MKKSAKVFFSILLSILIIGNCKQNVLAQTSPSVLFVPLIGITSVPDPLALPNGSGYVTYHYAVKDFIQEIPLSDVTVTDDKCSPTKFVEGDDNHNSMIDNNETWRYTCTAKLSETTQSTATATGHANNITTSHKAYATVVVGSKTPPPLVSIVNITKVANPLSLPAKGGKITFTYKVNNPGVVPLSDVKVVDNKCNAMSGKLGDTNGNNLLDTNEVWIYTCTATLTQTTTNTVSVTATANSLKAVDYATITVNVAAPIAYASTNFPNTGLKPITTIDPSLKIFVWASLFAILIILVGVLIFTSQKADLVKNNILHLKI